MGDGRCAICGMDIRYVIESFNALFGVAPGLDWRHRGAIKNRNRRLRKLLAMALRDAGFRVDSHNFRLRAGSLWQMDRIVPVVESGGECGLEENLRVLCTPCHRKEAAKLRARRARERRSARPLPLFDVGLREEA